MVRIENEDYLYEVELGSYSYFEDKTTGEVRYLPHTCRIMKNLLILEHMKMKIETVDAILKHTNKATHWAYEERNANYQNVIQLLTSSAGKHK